MKVSKKLLLMLFSPLFAGLIIYLIYGATDRKGQDDISGKQGSVEEIPLYEQSDTSMAMEIKSVPEAFRPVFDKACEFLKEGCSLPKSILDLDKDMDDDFKPDLAMFHDELAGKVEQIVNSPEFAMLAKEKKQEGEEEENRIIEGKVEKGDTISSILEKSSTGSVQHYISAAKKIFSLKSFKEGQPYMVHLDPDSGRIQRFEYEINNRHKLVVEGDEKPRAHLEDISYTILLDSVSSVIGENLFKAIADIGENPQLALRLVKLFGTEINFSRHLDDNDSFSVLIEKRYRNGEYKGYGRIIAAQFTNRGKTYEAFLFRDGDGKETYYNAKGESLNKTLLQSPLSVTRMTSRYSQNRFHPVLGYSRPHLGVDYGAPVGTPVKAVGDGVVLERGWAGGYGNQIVLKHSAGLESMYSHLSGFARGIRAGQKVSQGQVIGFVGSTGLSTGPHLDFRLRQNGKFINPEKAINPRGRPVAAPNREAFKKTQEMARACLNGEKIFENYAVDSIVPLTVISVKDELIVDDRDPQVRRERGKRSRLHRSHINPSSRRAKRLHVRRRH